MTHAPFKGPDHFRNTQRGGQWTPGQPLRAPVLPPPPPVPDFKSRFVLTALMAFVAHQYKLTPGHMTAPWRKRSIVRARHVFFHLARKHTDRSLSRIGACCHRHHTVVCYGARKVAGRLDEYGPEIESIERAMGIDPTPLAELSA